MSCNMFHGSVNSVSVQIGLVDSGGRCRMTSGALENFNVDLIEEITSMIQSQRNYTANSKVFQTEADLVDILVNLKI